MRSNDPRFSQKTANDTLSLQDLEGLTVGTGAGFKAEDLLAADKKIKLKSYDPDLPFNDLALGRIDAVLIDFSTVTYYVLGDGPGGSANKALKLIGKPFDFSSYVVAFNKNSSNATTLQRRLIRLSRNLRMMVHYKRSTRVGDCGMTNRLRLVLSSGKDI